MKQHRALRRIQASVNPLGAVRQSVCPACGYQVAGLFYDGGQQPLATLGWPMSAREARAMAPLPLTFVRCLGCGHVYNSAFDYRAVPYSDKPNRMFNRGRAWSGFLAGVQREIRSRLPENPVVVEIGHGDGSFLHSLASAHGGGRWIGFDPHGAVAEPGGSVELRSALFDPSVHMAELRPNLILSRHVLEHLTSPLGFIQSLAFSAVEARVRPLLYLEVPCIDRALETGRTEDFYYEHNSHFTTESFCAMLDRSGARLAMLGHGYGGEVVYGFLHLAGSAEHVRRADEVNAFQLRTVLERTHLQAEMDRLHKLGRKVAIWGGTGKSAAFLHATGADARRFPYVVDSDRGKAGSYVPGLGQQIRSTDWLRSHPVDTIVIGTQWRAADIALEIQSLALPYPVEILLPHCGRLVEFWEGNHPYRLTRRQGDATQLTVEGCDAA